MIKIYIKTILLLTVLVVRANAAVAADKPPDIKISVAGGYDNNTGLDAERKGDGLIQESVSVLHRRLLNSKMQLQLSYSALNVNYFEATDLNFLLNQPAVGLNYLVAPETIWETQYTFQHLYFDRNEAVTSSLNELRTGLRCRLSSQWQLRSGVSYGLRGYEHNKRRLPEGALSDEDEREDHRPAVDAQLTFKVRKDLSLNAGGAWFLNDSNDQFNDYYDYKAYKLYMGGSWLIAPKWMAALKFMYENRDYDSRPLVESNTPAQKDDLYTAYLSLYYRWTADLTLGTTYAYRQKNSNEPSQTYSGALGTLGLYYSF